MDIMELAEEIKRTEEETKKAEERLKQARESASKARRRRQRAYQRFFSEYKRLTGLSIRETQKAVKWMTAGIENADLLTCLKANYKRMIDGVESLDDMIAVINSMTRAVKKEIALRNLAKHKGALEAARLAGFLSEAEVEVIMKYGRGEEAD